MKAEELATSRKKGFSYNITSLWKEIIHSYRVLPSTKITKCPRVHIQKKNSTNLLYSSPRYLSPGMRLEAIDSVFDP